MHTRMQCTEYQSRFHKTEHVFHLSFQVKNIKLITDIVQPMAIGYSSVLSAVNK